MPHKMSGYGPLNVHETQLFWVLLNWKVQVLSRPKWNDTITIKTWPRSMAKCYSFREFEVYDQNGNLIAVASSKWALVSMNKGIIKISEEMEEKYFPINKALFSESLDKIKEPESSECTLEYTVQRRDIDTNHHVNNTIYLDYAYEALPKDVYEKKEFNNIEIMYKNEVKVNSTLLFFYKKLENEIYIVTIKNKEDKRLHAIIKLY